MSEVSARKPNQIQRQKGEQRAGEINQFVGRRLFTLLEVADFLRVSDKTVRRLIDEGKLKSIKVRGAIRIQDRDLSAYLTLIAA